MKKKAETFLSFLLIFKKKKKPLKWATHLTRRISSVGGGVQQWETARRHTFTPTHACTRTHKHTHTLHVCLSRKVRTNWLALYAAVVVSSTTTTRVGATRFSNYRRRRDPRRSEGVYVLGVAARDGGWASGGGVCVFRVRVCDCVQKGVAVVYRGGSDTFLKFMTLSSIVLTSLAAVVYVRHAVLTCLRARSAAPQLPNFEDLILIYNTLASNCT